MALKDFATSKVSVAPSPAISGTTLSVGLGHGPRFQDAPFYATIHPDGVLPTLDTAEKVLVTAKTDDDFTITRAQGDTTAKEIAENWRITAAIYADDVLTGTNSFVFNEVPSGSVNSSNTAFTTAGDYITGTLEVYINGLKQANAHITATDPGAGTFSLDVAPTTGDIVEVCYQSEPDAFSGNADTLDGEHLSGILQALYPIGAVYISGSSTMPALISAIGTWTRVEGMFILGASATYPVDTTGGAATHTHTLSDAGQAKVLVGSSVVQGTFVSSQSWDIIRQNTGGSVTTGSTANATPLMGNTDSGSTLPPYKAKYLWERTA